jgi:hypothetical protein
VGGHRCVIHARILHSPAAAQHSLPCACTFPLAGEAMAMYQVAVDVLD